MNTRLHTDTFLPYLRDVSRCERSLQDLGTAWRMIEASAKLNCPTEAQSILPIMSATQAGFTRLERELVDSLVQEKAGNVMAFIGTKARFVIDIVVRNLFERTADVGFLATDRDLCAFVAGQTSDADAIRLRLREYRSKYTVYNEILLLDTQGNVLVQIDPDAPVEGSTDPLIAQTLQSDGFVETFRVTDLRPGHRQALIYSQRLHHPESGAVVGVLCLSFDFEQEMAGIFRSHRDREGRTNLLLLDARGRVIASADERWIACGTAVPTNPEGRPQVFIHEGREYLLQTCAAEPYQGYPGPSGWQGQVMVPLAMAFSAPQRQVLDALEPATAAGLLSHARRFSPPLFEVMSATETIQRVVWNGQVITAEGRDGQQRLKAILDQISETGSRSNAVFSQSIRDLYGTVLESRLDSAESTAQLLVDLLDRNLYERANDCRWWALTPDIRAELASAAPDTAAITRILDRINGLYTVYRTLFVYDAQGRILAASNGGLDAPGSGGPPPVEPDLLKRVHALQGSQAYAVTPFAPSAMAGHEPTYVYHAAVRHPDDVQRVVGGIGIVFETGRELLAMLSGCVTQQAPAQAHFVDRSGRTVSSTEHTRAVGSVLDLPPEALTLKRGESLARVLVMDGQYQVVACAANQGYREFKTSDGYEDDVLGVVCIPLGAVQADATGARSAYRPPAQAPDGPSRMYATFWCGAHVLGLPAAHVSEAVPAHRLTGRQTGDARGRVGLLVPQPDLSLSRSVWVYDLAHMLGGGPLDAGESGAIVVVRRGGQQWGLLVDALHAVPAVADAQTFPSPLLTPGRPGLVSHLVKPADGQPLMQLIDVDRLAAWIGGEGTDPTGQT
jgi:hypothetical protein